MNEPALVILSKEAYETKAKVPYDTYYKQGFIFGLWRHMHLHYKPQFPKLNQLKTIRDETDLKGFPISNNLNRKRSF